MLEHGFGLIGVGGFEKQRGVIVHQAEDMDDQVETEQCQVENAEKGFAVDVILENSRFKI